MVRSEYLLITLYDELAKIGGLLKIFGFFSLITAPLYLYFFRKALTNEYNQQINNSTDN